MRGCGVPGREGAGRGVCLGDSGWAGGTGQAAWGGAGWGGKAPQAEARPLGDQSQRPARGRVRAHRGIEFTQKVTGSLQPTH